MAGESSKRLLSRLAETIEYRTIFVEAKANEDLKGPWKLALEVPLDRKNFCLVLFLLLLMFPYISILTIPINQQKMDQMTPYH